MGVNMLDKKTLVIIILAVVLVITFASMGISGVYESGRQIGAVDQLNLIVFRIQQAGVYVLPLSDEVNMVCAFQSPQAGVT